MKIKRNISLIFLVFIWGCSENIITECKTEETVSSVTTFKEVQREVFNKNCNSSGCHGGPVVQANLDLSEGNSYANLVGVKSLLNPQFKRVVSGDSENSFLIMMLKNSGNGTSIMPPTGKLNDELIDSIAAWIDRGAQNN